MKPNVVYILADDMGYGDVSHLNPDSRIRTENIDRVAASGITHTDAHASSAVCTPSRFSILTGTYCWRSKLKDGVLGGYSGALIDNGRPTVAAWLQDQGYRTACFGKWHLGLDWMDESGAATSVPEQADVSRGFGGGPVVRGFDEFYGISASLDMPPYLYLSGDKPTELPNRTTGFTDGLNFWREGPTGPDFHHIDVLPTIERKTIDFIHRQADSDAPFFAYVPLPAPHTPILPIAEFRGRSQTNAYGDFCLQVDAFVGAVRNALEQAGKLDDTILVFTSDNGCSPQANFPELHALGHHPSYVFRGHKADIYDGGHRVPLVVSWPAVIPAGQVTDQLVCLADLFATLGEVIGQPLPAGAALDSVSSLSVWKGDAGPIRDNPVRTSVIHHSVNGSFAIRTPEWKLELCAGSGGWSDPKPGEEPDDAHPWQLYNMATDIGERENRYLEEPDRRAALYARISEQVQRGRSTPGPDQPHTDPYPWPQLEWMRIG